ncbi:MAG: tetratricopeptide repeat protein [Flavobacteriales bacterium]|nr:tetratricopeptide repeat protein [Flavobacteriales bacterium]
MIRIVALPLLLLPAVAFAQGDALLRSAEAAYASGELDSALARVDRAIQADKGSARAYKLRGDIRQRRQQVELALIDYKESELLDPNNARLFVSRSAARITEGNIKGALRDLDRAIELDPADADAWYNRACAHYMVQDNAQALKDTEKALKLRDDHADALFLGGLVKGELFKEEAGLEDIRRALALKPEIPGARMSAAILLYEMERYEEAIAGFTEVLEKDTAAADVRDAHYYRGDSHYNLKRKEEACQDWRASAKLGDKDAVFIVKNYCDTDEEKIPKKPKRKRRKTVVSF